MYSRQKGILPTITEVVSYLLPFVVLILDMNYIIEKINTPAPQAMENLSKPFWLLLIIFLFFTMCFPIYFGMYLASVFQTIEVRKDGISFKYWEFFGKKIVWKEIDSIIFYPNDYVVIRIDKPGVPIFNGLYFNRLQARHIKSQLPILVFSPGLEKRDSIIKEIIDNSSPRIVHKK